jgi:hypothetical protein
MAHFTRVRTFGAWSANTTLEDEELEKFDAQLSKAINGDEGGSWSPTSKITLTGSFGLQSIILNAGGTILDPALLVDADGSRFDMLATFNNGALFDSTATFQGADTIFTGDVSFTDTSTTTNDGVWVNQADFKNRGDFTNEGAPFGNGKIITEGSRIELTDATYPTRPTTPLIPAATVPIEMVVSASSDTSIYAGNPSLRPGSFSIVNPIGLRTVLFHVTLNPNVKYTQVVVFFQGEPGTHGGIPANYPTATLLECASDATFTSLGTAAVLSSTPFATWESFGAQAQINTAAFYPKFNRHYVIAVTTEYGANAVGSLLVNGIRGTGTNGTVGNCGERTST